MAGLEVRSNRQLCPYIALEAVTFEAEAANEDKKMNVRNTEDI